MDNGYNVIQEYMKGHQKRETRIQWLLEDDEQKELYDDLGIIGEISSPECGKSCLSFKEDNKTNTAKFKATLQNSKQLNFETPCSNDLNMDVKLKRAMNRIQRKRSRQSTKLKSGLSHAKIGKMDLDEYALKSKNISPSSGIPVISQIPDEVLLKIFHFCNSETRVYCSQVCWRWYHIANDESLWLQVSLAKRTTNLYQIQRILKRGVKVLSLNCANVSSSNLQDAFNNSNSSIYDENSFTGSPRINPFSRAYNYSIHSIDLTNAIVSPNTLCLVLSRCGQLRNLSLEGLTISHNVLGFEESFDLTTLCLYSNNKVAGLFRSLSGCVSLERLNLCLCHELTMSGLTQLLSSCTNILELNLGWTNLCSSDPTQIISTLPCGLAQLNMSGFRDTLRDSHVIELIKRCTSLVEIDVSDTNLLTGFVIDQMIQWLPRSLRAVNLSRCYSISPNCFLRFSRLPFLRYLDVFGVMDDSSVGTLSAALPRVRVCLRPFSAIARPSPSALYGTRRRTIWGYLVM